MQADRPNNRQTNRPTNRLIGKSARQTTASQTVSPVQSSPLSHCLASPQLQLEQLFQLLPLFLLPLLPPRLADLQVQARDVSENNHRHAEKYIGAELEEPEGRLADAELQCHHRPEVEHSQERPGADGEGVLVVRLEPVVKCPV